MFLYEKEMRRRMRRFLEEEMTRIVHEMTSVDSETLAKLRELMCDYYNAKSDLENLFATYKHSTTEREIEFESKLDNLLVSHMNKARALIDDKVVDDATAKCLSKIDDAKRVMLNEIETVGNIVQSTGNSETNVMSQKATTDAIGDVVETLFSVYEETRTVNLFDGAFDESGFIDPSSGADASADGYKRTSKYYPIDGTSLTCVLSETVSPFVVVLYDVNKTCIGNASFGSLLDGREISADAKYFRIYTDATFNGTVCLNTEGVTEYVPYLILTLRNEVLPTYMQTEGNENLIDMNDVIEGKFVNYEDGVIVDFDDYDASDIYYDISSATFYFSLFNLKGGLVYDKPVIGAYYDESKSFVGQLYMSGTSQIGGAWSNGCIVLNPPTNAKYVRFSVRDSKGLLWQLQSSKGGYNKPKTLSEESLKTVESNDFIVACFGDSIFGNTRPDDETSIPRQIALRTKSLVYNFGFGGCQMSTHAAGWTLCSMYNLADCIASENFAELENAVNNGWSGMPGYFVHTVRQMAHEIDFADVDVITISYGTNDYREGKQLDNEEDKFDTETVCGALRYAVRAIQQKYPHIKIIVTTPVYRFFIDEDNNAFVNDADTQDWGGGTLVDYAEAIKEACKNLKIKCLDLHNESQLNIYTRTHYFDANDGTHPNANGRKAIAKLLASEINRYID